MNKLLAGVLIASVAVLTIIACGDEPAPVAPDPPATRPPPSVLHTRIAELQLDTSSLGTAIDRLRDLTHANVVIEWPRLKEIHLDPSAPVRVRLWDVTLGKALAIVLAAVDDRLGFQEQDGIITVSTRERLASKTVLRIYDMRGLIESLAAHVSPGETISRQEIVDALTKMIEDTIDTESWKDNGGSVGSLREILGLLVVEQIPANQARVQDLLEELQTGRGPHFATLRRPATQSAR